MKESSGYLLVWFADEDPNLALQNANRLMAEWPWFSLLLEDDLEPEPGDRPGVYLARTFEDYKYGVMRREYVVAGGRIQEDDNSFLDAIQARYS